MILARLAWFSSVCGLGRGWLEEDYVDHVAGVEGLGAFFDASEGVGGGEEGGVAGALVGGWVEGGFGAGFGVEVAAEVGAACLGAVGGFGESCADGGVGGLLWVDAGGDCDGGSDEEVESDEAGGGVSGEADDGGFARVVGDAEGEWFAGFEADFPELHAAAEFFEDVAYEVEVSDGDAAGADYDVGGGECVLEGGEYFGAVIAGDGEDEWDGAGLADECFEHVGVGVDDLAGAGDLVEFNEFVAGADDGDGGFSVDFEDELAKACEHADVGG